ncbi:PIN domain-containing protein [Amycolatopsis alkalitolerans]|uniref:Type II toxin-antitoxin system VapC family toxin n=1 Tax=Amycolatopsis alkalitolerans TaxID=2547244 RepID=A0A5C4M3F1_9PSEU|nr:PIN domain-containing protein [Amycolatopsis alkalitolerans]TNC27635.1 type II toxin-antitoxin system VapC family toxin [Amycolatopsis alkalitolerans]
MIYLDASSLVTFVVRRRHAEALDAFLSAHEDTTYTSTIGFVETVRTCDQIGSFPNLMATLLRDHNEIKVTDAIRDAAARAPGARRSLDAVHVASAEQLGSELTALVTYDSRMAEAARKAGLAVTMPGAE